MNTPFATRFAAFSASVAMTVAMLFGVTGLAHVEARSAAVIAQANVAAAGHAA